MNDPVIVWTDVVRIRRANPLVLNVTNNVVTNITANALLALGASPAMSHAAEDAKELAWLAQAVVLNIGTPAADYVESMFAAGASAREKGIPVILDPVAAGATAYRRRLCRDLLENVRPSVIRGNASEIMALAGENAVSKGADSVHGSGEARSAARSLARAHSCVVCVSGAVDYVTDGKMTLAVSNGVELMTKVTGLGCTATALIGAFVAVNADRLTATAHAMAVMGLAGELAAQGAAGPGTLEARFLDALYTLDETTVAAGVRLEAA
ncbi:MAG TPA: hydroxyethylthiazole kinase [Desulfovibrio sp.]|uniref:hydroxyethylthiazole kinase n=1 Tax=Desulfovibrio sp. TaxID=885 RepID=UPI002C48F973|nr:hydroxyethylthiazole kinase [Desulfovibrio sp.]HMM38423.1 hydroxyethylthiazole kinase [Desulfovibrio sp.]